MKRKLCVAAVIAILACIVPLAARGIQQAVLPEADETAAALSEQSGPYGQLYLQADGLEEAGEVWILLGGMPYMQISASQTTIDIVDASTVEIDTRRAAAPVTITIVGKSQNVAADCVGRCVTSSGRITNLGTFHIQ